MKSIRPLARTGARAASRAVVAVTAAVSLAGLCATAALAEKPSKPPTPSGWGVTGSDGDAAAQVNRVQDESLDADTLRQFQAALSAVTSMPGDGALQQRASALGLNILNVLWEDTGRSAGSSSGPNISDVTLQVREPVLGDPAAFRSHLLPVIRFPNFSDKTADVDADKLWIKVGNQTPGGQVVTVPLSEVLKNLREYVSDPDSIVGSGDLTAKRDSHYLVSAQHVFVPITKKGKIEFNPVIFNYQSSVGNPAVLTLLATREGTSVAAIENSGGGNGYVGGGQQLFFNNKGQSTTFTAERKSDVKARIEAGQATAADAGALDDGADMLLIIQVPLKFTEQRGGWGSADDGIGGMAMESAAPSSMAPSSPKSAPMKKSDVEAAVLGHGKDLGPVREGNKQKLERDDRFPVRVTVQFYKATSNGVVSDTDLKDAKAMIDKVYAKGDFVGSLVVPEGQRHRPTDWILGQTRTSSTTPKTPPPENTPTARPQDPSQPTESTPPPSGEGVMARLKRFFFD